MVRVQSDGLVPYQLFSDSRYYGTRFFMFPKSQDLPAEVSECGRLLEISFGVCLQLWCPVSRIGVGCPPMLRTAVPETAVDEDGYAPPGERNVWPDGLTADAYWVVFSEPVAQRV